VTVAIDANRADSEARTLLRSQALQPAAPAPAPAPAAPAGDQDDLAELDRTPDSPIAPSGILPPTLVSDAQIAIRDLQVLAATIAEVGKQIQELGGATGGSAAALAQLVADANAGKVRGPGVPDQVRQAGGGGGSCTAL